MLISPYSSFIFHPIVYRSWQGVYIRFRDMSGASQKYNIITVMNPAAQSHIVANLKKFTKYEFFIAPFYKTVEGQPSNSKVAQTFEDGKEAFSKLFLFFFRVCSRMDSGFNSFSFCSSSHVIVPSSPPDNVQTGMLNLTAGWVRWSPPPPQHHNGHLLGYKIQVSAVLAVVVKIAVCFDRIKSISHE